MADKRGFGSLLSAMAELFRDDEGQTDVGTEEAAGMAEVGTVETEAAVEAPTTPELPAGLADVIAAAIAEGFKNLMPVVAATPEGETEVGAAEVVAETETEEAVASVEEPAAEGTGMAEADLEATPEPAADASVGMAQADVDTLNVTLQKFWQAIEGIGARVGQLESVGMAYGGSTQVAATAPATAPQRKSLLQDFICR